MNTPELKRDSTFDDSTERANLPLRMRPSLSIRLKIVVSYSLFSILCIVITGWSFWMLSMLEDKIKFLEITDTYLAEIQQSRRFEKNYLLYGTDLDDALEHMDKAKKIMNENSKAIKKIMGEKNFQRKTEYALLYEQQLEKLRNVEDEKTRSLIVTRLRLYGGQLVSFAQEFVQKERNSVFQNLLLAKRVPFLFMSTLTILMILAAFFLTRHLMITFKRFTDYAIRIGEGDFSPIMPARKYRDEFTELAIAFNRMTKELDHRHNIILESHKLRAIGTLVAGVAHELNNPLNNTMLTAAMLKEDYETLTDDEKIEMIDDMINETERSQKIVKGLLDFARESETHIKPLNLEEIVRNSVRLVANQVKLAKIELKIDSDKNLPAIHGDEQMLNQVFINLIQNAVDALSPGGHVHIDILKNKVPNYLVVEIQDDGPGIPEHLQSRIFDPFFTTKSQGKGTGLGLSVTQGIIKTLGGYIHLKNSASDGTIFMISLPTTDSPAEIMSR